MKQITIIDQDSLEQFVINDNANGTLLNQFGGFEYGNVESSIEDIAGNKSAVYINSKHNARRISIGGDFVGDSIFTNRLSLLDPLRPGSLKLFKLTTYNDITLQLEAEITRLTNPYNHSVHSFTIEAIAPDWRLYSQTLYEQELVKTSILGGIAIPATIPLAFSTVAQDNVVTNAGNEITCPTLTIDGPGTKFVIGNSTTGESMTIEYTLVMGESIIVNTKNRTVKLDDDTNLLSYMSGEFWCLNPGANQINFFPTGEDGNTLLTVSWRSAYGGI